MNSILRPVRAPGVGGGSKKRPPASSETFSSHAPPVRASDSLVMARVCRPAGSKRAAWAREAVITRDQGARKVVAMCKPSQE